jgi:hypothetical protein
VHAPCPLLPQFCPPFPAVSQPRCKKAAQRSVRYPSSRLRHFCLLPSHTPCPPASDTPARPDDARQWAPSKASCQCSVAPGRAAANLGVSQREPRLAAALWVNKAAADATAREMWVVRADTATEVTLDAGGWQGRCTRSDVEFITPARGGALCARMHGRIYITNLSRRRRQPYAPPPTPPPSPASHQPSHVARVKVSRLFLFGAARVPARCASSALPQQNITIIKPGAHSLL